MNLFKLLIPISCFFLVACDNVDLKQYAADLSTEESKAKFPAYTELMSARVENNLVKHFEKECPAAPFVIISRSHSNTKAHIQAAALKLHIVEIHLDKLYQDKLQNRFENVLQAHHTSDTIFFIKHTKENPVDWKVLEKYQVIVESTESHNKEHMQFEFIPLAELLAYADKIASNTKKATLLIFAFLPHDAFFDVIERVLEDSKNAQYSDDAVLDAVFTQVQAGAPAHQHVYLKNEMRKFAAKYSNADEEQVEILNTLVMQISNPFLNVSNSITDMLNEHFKAILKLAKDSNQNHFDIKRVIEEIRHAFAGITQTIKEIRQ